MMNTSPNICMKTETMGDFLSQLYGRINFIKKITEKRSDTGNITNRGVYIFVINSKGQIYLQKRSESKIIHPSYYTASVSGHVNSGEDYVEAAYRELKEELNIIAPLTEVCEFKILLKNQREISRFYVCRYDGNIEFNREEISDGRFADIGQIEREMKQNKKLFTPEFKTVFEKYCENFT